MLIVNKLIPRGQGLAAPLLKRAARVELGWDQRQKSRFDAVDSTGRVLGVFLPRGSVLRGGDVLVAEDGSLVAVTAAAQQVLVVRHCSQHGAPIDLARAAYHLGNRHVAVEVRDDHLKLEPDHVLAALLRRMHLIVSEEAAAFEPEGGAYQGGHEGGHEPHGHEQDHVHHHDAAHDAAHDHGHDHAHDHGRDQGHVHHDDQGHVHGPGCKHDH